MKVVRSGISTSIIVGIVAVVVVIAGVGGYIALSAGGSKVTISSTTQTSATSSQTTSSQTISTVSIDTSQVVAQINQFQKDFDNRDVQGLAAFYTSSSVVTWSGNTQGLGGVYSGQGNIRLLYGTTIGATTQLTASVKNIQTAVVGANTVNATFDVILKGKSNVVGNLNATVKAQQQWVLTGGTWTIQKEHWNYLTFDVQNPGEATVFPQWSLQLSGQSPNLARMHVFEWNAGPYLLAVIYSLLIVVGIAALWVRYRKQQR